MWHGSSSFGNGRLKYGSIVHAVFGFSWSLTAMLTFIIRFLNCLNNKWHRIYNSLCHNMLNGTIIHLISVVIIVRILINHVNVTLVIVIQIFLISRVGHLNFRHLPNINITNNIYI
ncbi:hypothetical protein HanIR_Chr06g0298571 [Helianthus annuus]|nr:hypothetical protein HanIR_Chr06g0298571 [Helianthus annuus]